MKCVICGRRKGKRSCPAKTALICAQCCGEKRVLEIQCPEDCLFLETGREYERTTLGANASRMRDPVKLQRQRRVLETLHDVAAGLEYQLAEQKRVLRGFTDEQASEAVRLLLETLRTEDRGILYERTSSDPVVDSARRQLADAVRELRTPGQGQGGAVKLGEAIDVLEFILDVVDSHKGVRLGYLDYIMRMMPRRGALASSGPSLIIPGR